MNNHFDKYLKNARSVAMTEVEKTRIFNYLENLINEDMTLREEEPALITSPYHFHFTRMKVAVFALIAIFLLTTSTSYAATNSLPGDSLYPVKINLNEKIGSYLAARSGNSAKYESILALRRLEEVEILSSKNQLDDKTGTLLEANFQEHATRAELALSSTSSNDYDEDSDVAVNFQAGLIAHQGVLTELATRNNGKNDSKGLASFISGVSSQIARNNDNAPILAARLRSVLSSASATSVAEKLKSTADRIAEIEVYLKRSNVSSTTSDAVRVNLREATDLIHSANINLDAKSYQDAYLLLDQATTIANQVNSSLRVQTTAQSNLQPDINAASSSQSQTPSINGELNGGTGVSGPSSMQFTGEDNQATVIKATTESHNSSNFTNNPSKIDPPKKSGNITPGL